MKIPAYSRQKGFSLLEVITVMAAFGLLYGLISVNLLDARQRLTLTSTVSSLLTDIKQQQLKTTSLNTGTDNLAVDYGIYFTPTGYILFSGSTYSSGNSTNFTINLDNNFSFSTINLPTSQIIFAKGSGSVENFQNGTNSLTIRENTTQAQKTITINRFGVITSVN